MQDTALMRVMHGSRHQGDGTHSVLHVEFQGMRLVAGSDELHAEVRQSVMVADFIDRHDVRMIEMGGGFRFCAEPMHVSALCAFALEDHLERHESIERYLSRLVHNAHA